MSPRVAVIIPVHRHSALAAEAVASALALGPRAAVVAVDDGCPNTETRIALAGWRATEPRFHMISQANRGLPGARNTGIRFALAKYPGVEAIFPLDADNRLDPGAMTVFDRLLDNGAADWFYPHFDMFGLKGHAHAGPEFSLARLAESNISEAGSLIRRRVFDAGIAYDETMRGGYEDWEFWLRAAEAGFCGAPAGQSFFRYRKRPESMLSGSHDNDAVLRAGIRKRHPWLYARDRVARLWAAENPVYALVETGDLERLALLSDPLVQEEVDEDTLLERVHAARARPAEAPRPAAWAIARPGVLERLKAARLAPSILCHLHGALGAADIAALRLRRHPGGQRALSQTVPVQEPGGRAGQRVLKKRAKVNEIEVYETAREAEADALEEADILMIRHARLMEIAFPNLEDEARARRRIKRQIQGARVAALTLELEEKPEPQGKKPAETLYDWAIKIRSAPQADGYLGELTRWREDPRVSSPANVEWVLRNHTLNGVPLFLGEPKSKRIGFVAPIFQFGGVEKCLVALAAELKAQGVSCHLYVYGNEPMTGTEWMLAPFESVHHIMSPRLRDWSGPQYLGTNMAGEPPEGLLTRMLAPLAGMDAVIVTGCAALYHGLAPLRAKGIVTVAWEHLFETGGYGRTYGTPYLATAYEGGLDLILTCSASLSRWLHAQGVPEAKLLAIQNGPGFPMNREEVADALAAREARAEGPLRVGFLGRLDQQKGADRFLDIVRGAAGLPVEFSLTGGAVIGGGALDLPHGLTRHPPAFGVEELKEAFARLDVLLMPSRDEGLPLTIMEAQRTGVIPVATDVGAVGEAIVDGETGFLVPNEGVAARMTEILRRLTSEPALRHRVSRGAAHDDNRWALNARALMTALDALWRGQSPG